VAAFDAEFGVNILKMTFHRAGPASVRRRVRNGRPAALPPAIAFGSPPPAICGYAEVFPSVSCAAFFPKFFRGDVRIGYRRSL